MGHTAGFEPKPDLADLPVGPVAGEPSGWHPASSVRSIIVCASSGFVAKATSSPIPAARH